MKTLAIEILEMCTSSIIEISLNEVGKCLYSSCFINLKLPPLVSGFLS